MITVERSVVINKPVEVVFASLPSDPAAPITLAALLWSTGARTNGT